MIIFKKDGTFIYNRPNPYEWFDNLERLRIFKKLFKVIEQKILIHFFFFFERYFQSSKRHVNLHPFKYKNKIKEYKMDWGLKIAVRRGDTYDVHP